MNTIVENFLIESWVFITICAAFSQNLRSTYQKKLQNNLSDIGSTYVRFLYGLPFVIIYYLFINFNYDNIYTEYTYKFYIYCIVGGLSQIVATFLLLMIFNFKNFAVGTAYSKTEPIQAAFFGIIILNEVISILGLIGIIIGIIGVLLISINTLTSKTILLNLSKSTFYGIFSGTLFGISAVLFRGASISLNAPNYVISSGFTLLIVILIQTLILTIYLLYSDRKQIILALYNFKDCIIVGLFGALASICWFYAMSIQNVAYVRALGQIELFFTLVVSIFYFKERIKLKEIYGIFLILLGIIIIILNV